MEQNINQGMIDTTDSLEAVSVMKGTKNLLFWLLLLSLLVSQGVFWLNRLGRIDKTDCPACSGQAATVFNVHRESEPSTRFTAPVPLTNTISEQIERVTQQVGLDADQADPPQDIAEQPSQLEDSPQEDAVVEADRGFELDALRLDCITAGRVIRISNFVMFMAAMLYCLTLLMSLKISLTGKLGGINHISRAFFGSLYMLVFVTPWQVLLPGVVLGAMYLPGELLCGGWDNTEGSNIWTALYYLRFTGFWLLVVWLLLGAQSRSAKWARATLRRLGMTR